MFSDSLSMIRLVNLDPGLNAGACVVWRRSYSASRTSQIPGFDSSARPISGPGDSEVVSLAGLAQGSYLVRVLVRGEALNPSYSLTVNPPRELIADAFEPNDSRQTAAALGTVGGTRGQGGQRCRRSNGTNTTSW